METGHRYILEPYSGPGSRHTCPECGRKGTFVRYIDTATGEPLADNVGRCNREDSCGYHYKPRDYYADHPEKCQPYTPAQPAKFRPIVREWKANTPLESYTIPAATLKAFLIAEREADQMRPAYQRQDHPPELYKFLREALGQDRFSEVSKAYRLGSYRGAVVFWYIDREGRYRTGKTMHYRADGHRDRDRFPGFIHCRLKARGLLPENWSLRRCLFGEHLLRSYPAAPVALVESEKTAVIGAALCPGAIWLAAGGKHYINADTCEALKGRSVIAYPDLGAFEEWRQKLTEISRKDNFPVEISPVLERIATAQERVAGLDIADFLLRDLMACDGPETGEETNYRPPQ